MKLQSAFLLLVLLAASLLTLLPGCDGDDGVGRLSREPGKSRRSYEDDWFTNPANPASPLSPFNPLFQQ